MVIVGIDPGFASGGIARLLGSGFEIVESLPKGNAVIIEDRVDAAADWFCARIADTDVVCIENQHGTNYGQSRDRNSSANVIWVREVVGGIRRSCYRRGIPIRLIEPQEWRTRLGLPRSASKQQAWAVACNMRPELARMRTNEHSRDAAVVATVGSIAAHLWLHTWQVSHGRKVA